MTNKKNSGLLGKMIVPVVLSTFLYGCSSGGGGGGSSSSNNNGGDPVDPVYSCSATEKSTLDGLGLYQVPGLENKGSTEVSTSVSIDNGVNNYSALASCLADSQGGNVTISSEVITTSCDEGFQSNENQCEAIIQTPLNCEAGIFTSNGIDFGYDAFNHGETQNVSNTQKGTYENTTSTDTLGCDDGVVSSQGNFNQEVVENNLNLTQINQYLADNGYTQIEDLNVTFKPITQQADSNDSYQINAKVLDPKVFQIGNLQPNQNLMVADPSIEVKAYFTPSEEEITDLDVNLSYLSGTSNDKNVTAIVQTGVKRSELESKLEELQSGEFISTRDPILGYINGGNAGSGDDFAYALRNENSGGDYREDHGVPNNNLNIDLGIGPNFQVSGNAYLIDNQGNTIDVKTYFSNKAIGSFDSQSGVFSLDSDLVQVVDGIQRVDGEELSNGSYVLAQQFKD